MTYPTSEQLETITKWNNRSNIHDLLAYVHDLWSFADWGWEQEDETYYISTGGWSGNESIVEAMQSNIVWWSTFWRQTTRGGHYVFSSS